MRKWTSVYAQQALTVIIVCIIGIAIIVGIFFGAYALFNPSEKHSISAYQTVISEVKGLDTNYIYLENGVYEYKDSNGVQKTLESTYKKKKPMRIHLSDDSVGFAQYAGPSNTEGGVVYFFGNDHSGFPNLEEIGDGFYEYHVGS